MIDESTYTAGERKEFSELSDFFRITDSSGPVTVVFYLGGKEVARAEDVSEGYAEEMARGEFDRVTIKSASAQTVKFVTRYGARVSYDKPPTGAVTLAGMQGAFTQAQKTVTNASGAIFAANLYRRYLLIQNNDVGADVFVTLDGAPATAANGIKIGPGGSIELQGFVPSGAVNAIGSTASNANVVAVEG